MAHPQYQLFILCLVVHGVKSTLQSLHNIQNLFIYAIIDLVGLATSRLVHLCRVTIHNRKLFVQLEDILRRPDDESWLFATIDRLVVT